MFTALLVMAGIALVLGALLGFASIRFKVKGDPLVDKIDAILPQTQCAQCGYPGCRPYAAAIVQENRAINLCPPGGQDTVQRLADLLGREAVPLATSRHVVVKVALIDESLCIGCMHCRNACPVDAIVGAQHFMHTIIASECTGCELCVAPCPVDCISMVPAR